MGLLQCVRAAVERAGGGRVLAADAAPHAPAALLADAWRRVPRCTEGGFTAALLEFCVSERVALLVPTIDTELPMLARAAGEFARAGVHIAISSPETIGIAADKIATHAWLVRQGFPTVRQTDPETALREREQWPLPLIGKPRGGSASVGVRHIHSVAELAAVSGDGMIVQEVAAGREFTVNLYVDRRGRCRCAVPHWRMEVRAGEVAKGLTVKNRALMALAARVAEALPGARGPLNVQCFVDGEGAMRIIEINARFGGGYPLADRAGARFADWLLEELAGRDVAPCDDWTDQLAMLRFDEAVYLPGEAIATSAAAGGGH